MRHDSMLVHRCVLILVPLLNCKQKKARERGGGVEGWRGGEEERRGGEEERRRG